MDLRKKSDGIVLCCNKVKCPIVHKIDDKKISITDDDGNRVVIDIDQAKLLPKAIEELND